MKVWREVHGVSIRRATILTTTVTVMEMTLLVVIEKTGWNSRNNKTSSDQKMLSIYTRKTRASGRILVLTSRAYLGGWNSPQINEVPQTAMRATKKGHDSCNNPSQKPVGITAM